ncbi:nuclear transport factor 2 family protein [Nocardia sp. NBC_01503]|uniref:nuclear transport factor 2 family protein n=1 Tax=Nocardia sp. NBC_01503 TaxID=2975997 RepID=UPI002E7B7F64|nr:nuclear transport factor 2 family protein [Nocardia sp. NBC_01503]WTL33160.1 nuclear transport factor 2 family protein [Nocardia sp. NBC_01503]
MTTTAETPRELVERLFRVLPERDAEAFVALFAPEAVFEIPFVIPGFPSRFQGREEIRAHLERWWSPQRLSGVVIHGIHPTVYQTSDPETLWVENDVDLTRPGAERARVRTSVNVVRVHDGQVTLFRDYMDTNRVVAMVQQMNQV